VSLVVPRPLPLATVSYTIHGTAPTRQFFDQKTCQLLLKGNIQNLPGAVILRQLTVVFGFFVAGVINALLDTTTGSTASKKRLTG
jgi:hypothetical protein